MKALAVSCFLFGAVLVLGARSGADEPAAADPVSNGKPLSAWIKELKAPEYNTREKAARAIGQLGPRAKAAVPALLKAMAARPGQVPAPAGAALWKVDRQAFTKILAGPAEKNSRLRYVAVLSLLHIGADAKELAPLVLKIAAEGESPNREHALWALGYIGADPVDVVPVLTAAVQEGGQSARMHSAQALGHLGPKAKDALPVLYKALADSDPQVRVDAAKAAWKIERAPRKVLPVLTEALKEGPRSAAVQRAVRGLGDIGPAAKEAFPALLDLWKVEQNKYSKGQIAKALKAIDAKAAEEAGVKYPR